MRPSQAAVMGARVLAAVAALGVAGAARAQCPDTIYNSIPDPLAGNIISLGYQATQTSEFGDHVMFLAGTPRNLASVKVALSSWGCESGHWTSDVNPCVTTPGATFTHPITVNLYSVRYVSGVPHTDALLASMTQAFSIPYRPSWDPVNCPVPPMSSSHGWFDAAAGACYNGRSHVIEFDLSSLNVVLPDEVIVGVAYNTSNYGAAPIGAAPCQATPAGCPYDSLNVGADANGGIGATAGIDVDPDVAFWSTVTAGNYCDGGAAGVGVFRADGDPACSWADFIPTFTVQARAPAPPGSAASPCSPRPPQDPGSGTSQPFQAFRSAGRTR